MRNRHDGANFLAATCRKELRQVQKKIVAAFEKTKLFLASVVTKTKTPHAVTTY